MTESGVAAVRGAITATSNTRETILDATGRLLAALVAANGLEPARVVSAIFTVTADLDAEFPAHAARAMGWSQVPLLCAREIDVAGALAGVIRVLITVSGVPPGVRLVPVYLDGAAALRPDLAPTARATGAARRTVALVGLGQIGGSIGFALGRRGDWWRVGFDADPATSAAARARGAIDAPAATIADACAGAALAVIAVPVGAMGAAIDAAAAALPPGAALIDTGSTRRGITPALERAAARGVRAVGGHPLAGSEGRGFAAARADRFEGAPFVVLPLVAGGGAAGAGDAAVAASGAGVTPREPAAAAAAAAAAAGGIPAAVTAMISDLGATLGIAQSELHDRALARTSHLPYLLACALRDVGQAAAAAGLAGPAFRDATRVARSDPAMAMGYCRANATPVAEAWRELRARVDADVARLGGDGPDRAEAPE